MINAVKSLLLCIFFSFYQGCTIQENTSFFMYIPECTLMEKEVVLLMEYTGDCLLEGRSIVTNYTDLIKVYYSYITEYHEKVNQLSKMYENAVYVSSNKYIYRLPKCNKFSESVINIRSVLEKSDTTTGRVVLIKDRRFKLHYDYLNSIGELSPSGKVKSQFEGHIYKAFKVKIQCLYAGKHFQLIRNFGLHDSNRHFQRKALCNVYVVTRIDSIEPIDIDASKITP